MGQKGGTLLEAVVGLGIASIVTLSVCAAALSGQRMDNDLAPREEALESVQGAAAALANYVSADHTAATAEHAPAERAPDGTLPATPWAFPGDLCGYAFDPACEHDATAFLSPDFRARFPLAKLSYAVRATAGDSGPTEVRWRVQW